MDSHKRATLPIEYAHPPSELQKALADVLIPTDQAVYIHLPDDVQRIILYYIVFMPTLGVIFHWGLYSVPAYDDVASVSYRRIQNGSEWYAKRLTNAATSGGVATQRYHRDHYGDATYSRFASQFTASSWKPIEWLTLAKAGGATYAILTAKHHDGFCLWNTKTTQYSSQHTGAKRDLLQEFAEACKTTGLRFCIYYSWNEFDVAPSANYLAKMKAQVMELITYHPHGFWFDGDWTMGSGAAHQAIKDSLTAIRKVSPNIEINDRIGYKQARDMNRNWTGGGCTYRVYADREIPTKCPTTAFETIYTIGLSWGRNRQQQPQHYKTAAQLRKLRDQVYTKHGRLLINFGPDATGVLDEHEVAAFKSAFL